AVRASPFPAPRPRSLWSFWRVTAAIDYIIPTLLVLAGVAVLVTVATSAGAEREPAPAVSWQTLVRSPQLGLALLSLGAGAIAYHQMQRYFRT
ncbi:MAG TPA: hypothetical protein VFF65_04850, partial [Phycisphaerales bacterium]|nr:hypothetical protein [Phycisphaerales bacterium]